MFCPRPHSMRCIPPTRAPSSMLCPFMAFYTPYFIFIHITIYQTWYIQWHLHFKDPSSANKGVFLWDSARTYNAVNYDGGGLRYHPKIYPSESDTPAPSIRPPIPLVKAQPSPPSFPSFSLLGIRPSSNASSKATLRMSSFLIGSIQFSAIGRHTLQFIVLTILVRSALVADTEDAMSEVDVLQPYLIANLA